MKMTSIVQARMSSQRCPGKTLHPVGGRPLLRYLLERLSRCRNLDRIVVATSTDPTDAPLFRLPIEPDDGNGLRAACRLMVDKITTVPKEKIGTRIGRLADEDIVRLNRAVLVFLGIAGPTANDGL